jgi:hypothetical protein
VAKVYADVHVPFAVVNCLRDFGADVLRVQDDDRSTEADEQLLSRATALGRLVLTRDHGFVKIGRRWQSHQRSFSGIAYITSNDADPRSVAESVMILLRCGQPSEVENQVHYLPL